MNAAVISLCKIAIRTRWYIAIVGICALMFLVPSIFSLPNGSSSFEPSSNLSQAEIQSLVQNGIMSQEEADLRFGGPQEGEALQMEGIAELHNLYSTGGFPIYANTSQEAGLYRVASLVTCSPYLFLFIPSLLSCSLVCGCISTGTLFSSAPIRAHRLGFAVFGACLMLSVASTALTLLPSFAWSSCHNGVGTLDYPCAYIANGGVHIDTLASVLGHCATLSSCGVALLCATYSACAALFHRPVLSTAAGAVIAMLPLLTGPLERQGIPASLFGILPSSYIPFSDIAGKVSYSVQSLSGSPHTLSWEYGCMVLLISILGVFIVVHALSALPGRRNAADDRRLLVEHLTVGYRKKQTILNDASLCVNPGEIVGLVAPNGNGKTTLLKTIGTPTYNRRSTGMIAACGMLKSVSPSYKTSVLYVSEDEHFLDPRLSCSEHLALVKSLWPNAVPAAEALRMFSVEGFADKPTGKLSQGMRQLALLAVAYSTGSPYLLLDEPMNSLDPLNVACCTAALRRMAATGISVVMSSHLLDILDKSCDRVVYIVGGKLAEPDKDQRQPSYQRYRQLYESHVTS